jgi:hypothetical protein
MSTTSAVNCPVVERCRRSAHCFPAACRTDCHFRPFVLAVAPGLPLLAVDPPSSALRAALGVEHQRDATSTSAATAATGAAITATPDSPHLKLQMITRASSQRQLRVWLVLPPAASGAQTRWLDAVCAAGQARIDTLRTALADLRTPGTAVVPRSCRFRADKCIAWGCTWEPDPGPGWPQDDAVRFSRAALAFLDLAMRSAEQAGGAAAASRLNGHLRLRTGRPVQRFMVDPVAPAAPAAPGDRVGAAR